MLTKRIKNNTGSDKTYQGQVISPAGYYQIQSSEEVLWANDSALQADITSGAAVVNNGTADLGSADGLVWLSAISASHISGIKVDTSGIGDQKKIIYDSASNSYKFNADSPGSASGAKGEIQFRGNSAGSFTASSDLSYDDTKVALSIGANPNSMAGLAIVMTRNRNSWAQHVIQNLNSGTQASSDIVANSDMGADTSGYIDMGINSSGYSDSTFQIAGGGGDGYLFVDGGNLGIGTFTSGKNLHFVTGGFGTTNERLRFVDAAAAKDAYALFLATLVVDSDTTANRPASPINGMIRYNSTTNKFEAYESGAWANMISAGGSGGYYQNITLSDQTNQALTTTSGSYTVMSRCVFPGSTVVTLNKVFASVSVSGSSANMDIRIYDLTNSKVICEKLAIADATPTANDMGAISNIPTGVAVFEVQMRANGGSGKTAKCSSVLLRS